MLEGIAEMFAELDGYTNGSYEAACERHYAWILLRQRERWAEDIRSPAKRAAAVERTKAWRRANPDRYRALQREQARRDRDRGISWGQRHPDRQRAAKARYRDANPERMREIWRRNQAAARARKAARNGPDDTARRLHVSSTGTASETMAAAPAVITRR